MNCAPITCLAACRIEARSLIELLLADGAYAIRATHVGPALARTALFPDLEIDLGEVFARP